MKSIVLTYACTFLSIMSFAFISDSFTHSLEAHTLLGITWCDSKLVSFDPYRGTIIQEHTIIDQRECFRGLTYDSNRGKLYALSQVENNLYSIDPATLDVVLLSKLNIDPIDPLWGYDAGALAYDPITDSLYIAVEYWYPWYEPTNIKSELIKIDIGTAQTTSIGNIYGPFITSFDYNIQDGYLYGLAVYGSGSWDSPYKSNVVRINPFNADMETLFVTPYHTILGFASKPDESRNIFYSWINWTSHFYGKINIDNGHITPLGSSDNVDVISAMVYKDFDVPSLALATDFVKVKPVLSTRETTEDITDCPGYPFQSEFIGKMTFEVQLRNVSKAQLTGLLLRITDLPEEHVLLNVIQGEGEVGSIIRVPKQDDFSDGILGRKDSLQFPITMCYKHVSRFQFSADVLAVVNPHGRRQSIVRNGPHAQLLTLR